MGWYNPYQTGSDVLKPVHMDSPNAETLLTKQQLADRLQKSPQTIDRWRRSGWLPKALRMPNGTYVWFLHDIDKWLLGLYEDAS